MMRALAKDVFWLAVVAALVIWVVNRGESVNKMEWIMEYMQPAKNFFTAHPALTVGLFCLAHLASSAFSLPGSCTALNIVSGFLFGFWTGCLIVYPVTMLSACLVYLAAGRWAGNWIVKKYP